MASFARGLQRAAQRAAPLQGALPRTLTQQRSYARVPAADGSLEFEFTRPFKGHNLEVPPSRTRATKAELLQYWRLMTEIRRLEVASDLLYKQKLIRGFCHLYNGMEAVAVGSHAAMHKDDHTITAYRDHGWLLLRGSTFASILGELMGRQSGCSKGKGGSMHMYSRAGNFHGGNGIVGAQVPLGAGIAFAQKYLNTGKVCVALYGDGAANQGQVFEAFNLAALYELPVVFVCENNQYAMGTSAERSAVSTTYYTRGDYIPGIWIDGMDVLAAREGMRFACEYARVGRPIVVEMNTYRFVGHSMSDPGTAYRTRDEVDKVRAERDPIDRVAKWLLEAGWATEPELKALDKEIRLAVQEAVEISKAAPEPSLDELFTDVYVAPVGNSLRGVEYPAV